MSTTVLVDIVTVAGPDAQKFLHSLVSQDVATLDAGAERWSFLLQPQGKVVGFFRIAHLAKPVTDTDTAAETAADTFELVLDAGAGAAVRDALQRYLIRTKATLTLAEGVERPGLDEAARIAAGLPRWGREITESTVPNETGLTLVAVNFTKGCYVGQELVERIDSRGGNVPKRLCFLRLGASIVPDGGLARLEREGKDVGTITSAALDPSSGRAIALGYVRREVGDGGQLDVRWGVDGADVAIVEPLPIAVAAIGGDAATPVRRGAPRFTSGRP